MYLLDTIRGEVCIKRLGIVSIYDEDGIIYDYLVCFLRSLNEIVDKLVIVVNGGLKDQEEKKIQEFTKYTFYRKNEGFDAGGYKYILENHISFNELMTYDEVILSNDTCFGPFIPIEKIFQKMENKKLDYWGVDFYDNNIFQYIQSNFLVFSRKVISEVYYYFMSSIDGRALTKHQVCMEFERGLFRFLQRKGYKYGYYTKKNSIDPYSSPNKLIEKYNYPFIKKRGFKICYDEFKHNFIHAINLVKELYNYDVWLICDYVKKKYGITDYETKIDLKKIKEVHYEKTRVSQIEIEDFCNKYNKVYIFGTGFWGQDIYQYYKYELKNFYGFVVSDEQFDEKNLFGENIYKYSEIATKDTGIIVGLSKGTFRMVEKKFDNMNNCLYLWK